MPVVDFLTRLKTLELTIWSYARHYEIRGVLLAEDLYQEGLIELDETAKLYPDLDHDVFVSYFKVRMASRFKKQIRYHMAQCRDCNNTVVIWDLERFLEVKQGLAIAGDRTDLDYCQLLHDELEPSPEDALERKLREAETERFIAEVKAGLDDEAQWAFDQLLSGEVPEQLHGEFKRVPGHVSVTVIGLIFGWDRAYAYRVIQRVRRRVKALISQKRLSGTSLLWSAA